jgi:hypothetical protein
VVLPTTERSRTPALVYVLGILYLATGLLALVEALVGIPLWANFRGPVEELLGGSDSEAAETALSIYRHLWIFLAYALVVGGVSLVFAIQFLRRRRWARQALEGLAWFGLVAGTGLNIGLAFWIPHLFALIPEVPAGGMRPEEAEVMRTLVHVWKGMMGGMMQGSMLVGSLGGILIQGLIILGLRSARVRDACDL